jgi:hypothetical protein
VKECPELFTWQGLVDGEIENPELWEHLDRCTACREIYREISASAALADGLFTHAALPSDFARQVLRRIRPFPAGLLAALLFSLLAAAALLSDPNGLHWWLTAGMTRQVSFVLDAAVSVIYLLQNVGPAWFFTAVTALVALEILLLHKIQTAEV